MNTPMPRIDRSRLPQHDAIVAAITKRDGSLRASKPMKATGDAKYVWRMVAFSISPVTKHQCIPTTADFDIEIDDYRARMDRVKSLDKVVDAILATVPKTEWHGVQRWARAFGAPTGTHTGA